MGEAGARSWERRGPGVGRSGGQELGEVGVNNRMKEETWQPGVEVRRLRKAK